MASLIPNPSEIARLAPEIAVIGSVVAILIAPFFSVARSNLISGAIALVGLIAAFLLTLSGTESGPILSGLLVIDPAAIFWKQLLLIFTAGVVLIWFSSTRHALRDGEGPEFFVLLLSAAAGMMLMGETSHLLMLLLATEIASMPSYVLAGFRKTRRIAAEASLKFVLFGAVCTAMMIYGLSLLYGTHHTLHAGTIVTDIQRLGHLPVTTIVGLIGLMIGLLFKVSAVPVHFWCPDVFEGAHVDVAAFLSVASKGAGIVLLCRLASILGDASGELATGISVTLGIVGVVTMTVGNLGALQQTSVKRLLAFSSIAHAGYIVSAMALLGSGAMGVVGLYLAIYLLMNLGAFAVLGEVESKTGSDRVDAFNGLSASAPLVAIGMAAALLSLVGLPPLGGFWAKLKVMTILASSGGWWWVVVAAVGINSIISLAFYARVLRAMYLSPAITPWARVSTSGAVGIACAIGLVLSFVFFAPVERTCERLGQTWHASNQTP